MESIQVPLGCFVKSTYMLILVKLFTVHITTSTGLTCSWFNLLALLLILLITTLLLQCVLVVRLCWLEQVKVGVCRGGMLGIEGVNLVNKGLEGVI